MEGSRRIFCRLCFNTVRNENFTVIDQSAREMLRTVSSNMELDNNHKHVMCFNCSVKLYAAFDFKYICLYVEDRITSYANPTVSFVDLKEVYLKERNKTCKMEDDQRVCRLCLQLVTKGSVSFDEMKSDMINNYIPEVNFGVTQDPVVCGQCFDSLSINETFIRTFLNVEMKIRNTDDKRTFTVCKNDEIKLENKEIKETIIKIEEPDTAEMLIESEEINIKVEEEERESGSFPSDSHNEVIENNMNCFFEDVAGTTNEYVHNRDTETELNKPKNLLDISSDKSDYKNDVDSHQKHKTVRNSIPHQLIKKSSNVMYKCDTCTYETKHRSLLRTHRLTHKGPEEVQIYKCDACSHISDCKGSLEAHQLLHKIPSETQLYKCETCGFATKFRQNLELHLLIHKYSSQMQKYKCNTCNYETVYKNRLISHQSKHKEPPKIQMFKCDTCDYETKFKRELKSHVLTHKEPTENQMYKCDICPLQYKYKGCLKNHQLAHKDSSEYQVYICDTCGFATKQKNRLKMHLLSHKDPSEIQTDNCDSYTYETRSKRNLRSQQLTNNGSPESQM